jgi:dimethylaniline monooxygenase (N-oxide forming)
MIIFCTGYNTVFPFLKDEKYIAPINERFKFIFHNDDPTLAFIGFTRPVVGSIPTLSELQSIYIGKIFSGKLHLPNKEVREKIIRTDKEYQRKLFHETSNRIVGLVSFAKYAEQLAILSGINPDFFKLFLKSPKKWLAAVSAPYNSCRFHLADESQHERIFDTFKHRTPPLVIKHSFHFVKLLFFQFFPFLFLKKKRPKIITTIFSILNIAITSLLWILFSPYILYQIFANRIKNRAMVK